MVRSLSTEFALGLQSREIEPRNFVVIKSRSLSDASSVTFGFWDDAETVSQQVVDPISGTTPTYTFYGDGAITKMDSIPMRIGLEVRTIAITMSALHDQVQSMVRGTDVRLARVEVYRGLLAPRSVVLVAPPRIRFLGRVNAAPVTTASAGGKSEVVLRVVSDTRELTRTSPAVKSDEQQKLRSGDRFRRYTGVTSEWPVFWGEESK